MEEMCTAVQIKDTEDSVYASAVVSGNSRNIGVYGILRAVLDLETRGAHAIGVSVQVILPTYAYESRLKEMFRCMEEKCAAWGIAMTCAKAEVSPAVSQAVVSVTAVGRWLLYTSEAADEPPCGERGGAGTGDETNNMEAHR